MAVVINFADEKKRPDPLSLLNARFEKEMAQVNTMLSDKIGSRLPLIGAVAEHLIMAGGKRIRPLLTLAGADLCGYKGNRHIHLSACIEFIHSATLLHDDVVDESPKRRGKDSANAIWDNKAPVLIGDFLFTRAFELMVDDGSLDVLGLLSRTASILAEGEVLQLTAAGDPQTTETTYLDIVRAKTASLFAAACRVGAILAEKTDAERDALQSFGLNLGIAFQLADDVLDYAGDTADSGKITGNDLSEGKITLPFILAYSRSNKVDRLFLESCLKEETLSQSDFARAFKIMKSHGCLEDSLKRADHYAAIAKDALGIFPPSDTKSALLDLCDFCVKRER